MIISEQEIASTKEKIQKYYQTLKLIELQKQQAERLEKRLESINRDRNNPYFTHSLSTELKGITYDKISIQGGSLPTSPMENEIEQIYSRLSREYEYTTTEWIGVKQNIRKAEAECERMGFYIEMLNAEHRNALELKYKYNAGITKISLELHIAKSTVCKYLKHIYEEIAKLTTYYE